uniref:Replication factor A C-terminal domain-containing protein n=1 Tax=Brassica campestris TaxID=3711 RepID=M4EME2_BRACM
MKPMLWLNSDDTGTWAFLGFNAEVTKLTHVLAFEAAQIVGIGPTAQVDVHLPRSFADIVRNTYTFQLKLKDFNITVNHQAFTISRIFHARDLASIITFVEVGEVTKPALLQNVSPGSEDIAAITSNVAEHSPAADGAIPGHEAVAKEQVDPEENASKKASVE